VGGYQGKPTQVRVSNRIKRVHGATSRPEGIARKDEPEDALPAPDLGSGKRILSFGFERRSLVGAKDDKGRTHSVDRQEGTLKFHSSKSGNSKNGNL
jgi:hypothetical protein